MENKMTMAGLGAMVLGTVLIIVLYSIIPMIGYQIDESANIPTDTAATGTFTSSTNVSKAEMEANTTSINLSSETYVFTNGTTGPFQVDLGGGYNDSANIIDRLVTEINANSTLVTAVDNADNSTTVTSVITGTVGDAYATTDNATGQAWASTTLSGGVDGSNWDEETNTDLPTGYDFWATVSGFITLTALMLFVVGFMVTLKGIKS